MLILVSTSKRGFIFLPWFKIPVGIGLTHSSRLGVVEVGVELSTDIRKWPILEGKTSSFIFYGTSIKQRCCCSIGRDVTVQIRVHEFESPMSQKENFSALVFYR